MEAAGRRKYRRRRTARGGDAPARPPHMRGARGFQLRSSQRKYRRRLRARVTHRPGPRTCGVHVSRARGCQLRFSPHPRPGPPLLRSALPFTATAAINNARERRERPWGGRGGGRAGARAAGRAPWWRSCGTRCPRTSSPCCTSTASCTACPGTGRSRRCWPTCAVRRGPRAWRRWRGGRNLLLVVTRPGDS